MHMSKTARLFQLMTALRRLSPPVTAEALTQELNVSIRAVYRDIEALRGLGAVIDGEAGFGFTLVEDASLPPLGFEDDERDFRVAALMLQSLGYSRVRVLTNNPRKLAGFEAHGITVEGRVPLAVGRTAQNTDYLDTKAAKSGHLL